MALMAEIEAGREGSSTVVLQKARGKMRCSHIVAIRTTVEDESFDVPSVVSHIKNSCILSEFPDIYTAR